MAVIRKRVTKHGYVYDVDFTYKGKRRILSTGASDLATAKKIRDDIQTKIALGSFDIEEQRRRCPMLSRFFQQYFDYAESFKAKGTIVGEKIYSAKFVAFVGDRSVDSVDAKLLDLWKAHTLKDLSATTFNIERKALHAMFNVALKWGYIVQNPFAQIKSVKVEERRRYLTNEELMSLKKEIDKDIEKARNSHHRKTHELFLLFIEFLLHTGLRREEALRLEARNIDLKKRTIHIEKTKSKKTRVIPLTDRACDILEGLGESLFPGLTKATVSRKFRTYAGRAGLKGFKLHSLRHTYSTILIDAGVDVVTVSKLLGHEDIKTTLIYAKTQLPVLQTAVKKLEMQIPWASGPKLLK